MLQTHFTINNNNKGHTIKLIIFIYLDLYDYHNKQIMDDNSLFINNNILITIHNQISPPFQYPHLQYHFSNKF